MKFHNVVRRLPLQRIKLRLKLPPFGGGSLHSRAILLLVADLIDQHLIQPGDRPNKRTDALFNLSNLVNSLGSHPTTLFIVGFDRLLNHCWFGQAFFQRFQNGLLDPFEVELVRVGTGPAFPIG